ncbi:uncharacterized protein LOC103980041 isoform X2 [Musa acuminata AAA Group]|uniref:uncharacterized protein LOC103980041 isoform X2 n=1 Tax=Musa acuminata AAA Group TaxID=214697 RepID=UPI0031E3FEE1
MRGDRVHTRTQEEGGEKLLIRIDGAIRSLVCGQVSDQTPGEHPPRESISGSLFLVLKSGMGKIKSCGNELKHPNLCYCSVGQREANCKEFVLRAAETRICCFRNISGDIARKAKEKNKFLPSFQSFRPFNLATYAVCRAKHTAAIGYPLTTRYRWNNPHQKDMICYHQKAQGKHK